MELYIEAEAKELGIFVFMRTIENVNIKKDEKIEEKIAELERTFSNMNIESLKDDPVVRAYRDFFWRIGIDPTKIRPSGEALRRRIVRGNKLPRINNVVDAGNIASAITLVPIGIYDLQKIKGNLRIKLSNGEEFFPIGSDKPEKLGIGIPILIDEENKVLHLYPHRDSNLTKITDDTKSILILAAGVPNVPKELVKKALELTSELILISCPYSKMGDIKEVN